MLIRSSLKISILLLVGHAFVSSASSQACDYSKYRASSLSHFLQLALIKQAVPTYPAAGKAVRAQGIVKVKILVDKSGIVRYACANSGHPLLRPSAEWAARKSIFRKNFGLSLRQKKKMKYMQDTLTFKFILN